MTTKTKEKIKKLYFDYLNNFLTVTYFAEYYNITKNKAYQVIRLAKKMGA